MPDFKKYYPVETCDGRKVGVVAGMASLFQASQARNKGRKQRGRGHSEETQGTCRVFVQHPIGFQTSLVLSMPDPDAGFEEIDTWLEAHFVADRFSFLSATIQLPMQTIRAAAVRFGSPRKLAGSHQGATTLLSNAIAARRQTTAHQVPSYDLA